MRVSLRAHGQAQVWASSVTALALAMLLAGAATAQTLPAAQDASAAQADADTDGADADIVVTGSRITRQGFDQPTPTTVIGEADLRQGARPNIQQVLNDLPQVRGSTTPATTNGNTEAGRAPVDLRGLGDQRTLVLLDGRRFVGENNLNFIPVSLVKRVEVVTGGASAAWGSGAVAGVVNILLDKELKGLSLGAQSGISSRGDGFRYGFDGSFGTSFADDRGHVLIGAEYVNDRGIFDRSERPYLNSPGFVPSGSNLRLVRDVNFGNVAVGGLITSGSLAGQVFNPDGTLHPFRSGVDVDPGPFPIQMIGGADGINVYDTLSVASPFERLSSYGRLSYEIGKATFWVDGTYGRSLTNTPFFTDFTVGGAFGFPYLEIQSTNPFLPTAVRNQLAAAGETSFTLGRYFDDALRIQSRSLRVNKEAAIGVDGTFGDSYKYRAWYSHGEIESHQRLSNSLLGGRFGNAIDAVSFNGQTVCGINADADPSNNDPACQPINPFGAGNVSASAQAYITGTQRQFTTNKLDSTGAQVQGDVFSLWAGPVTIAVGAEARWEEQDQSRDAATIANAADFNIGVYTSDVSGGFNVREAFAEVALPLLKTDALKLDANGAARYSDYSTSGGIWSWKVGGTARLFEDILLRATRSRDIRSPNIPELFASRDLVLGPLNDQDDPTGRAAANPAYNPQPSLVRTFIGGNPDLEPEVAYTTVIGGSVSPSFLPGFSASVDYYDIKIGGAITSLNGSSLTLACSLGSADACGRITRDATGTVVEVSANQQNIATFRTSGIDIEASYLFDLSKIAENLPGRLRLRGLATHIDKLVFDTGDARIETAGDVGDTVARATPKWRGTLSASYESDQFGFDVRARYVGGGTFDRTQTTLLNNSVKSRTYVDIGAQFKVGDRFTLFGNVNNVFDRDPPLVTVQTALYDVAGTYFTTGARVRF